MEDFGYQKDEGKSNFSELTKRAFLVGATLFSLACFVYVTISAYYFVYHEKDGDVELIKAEEGPIKVLEEEKVAENSAASMQIDRSIYEDIFGNKARKKEVIVAKVNQIPQPASPPKPMIEADRRLIKETIEIPIKENLPQKKPEKKNLGEQKIVVFSDAAKKESPSQDLLTKTRGEEKAAPTKVKSEKRVVKVQIAAMASETSAKEAWNKLNQTHSGLFSGLKPFTEAVNLGKRGIFYRLQIGNFYNQIEAEEFCNRYVAKTQKSRADCIVVE